MHIEINRPTLANLWRVLHTILEGLAVENAPEVARLLAVAGLTGRHAEARGLRVERRGEAVLVIASCPPGREDWCCDPEPAAVAVAAGPARRDRPCHTPRGRRPALAAH